MKWERWSTRLGSVALVVALFGGGLSAQNLQWESKRATLQATAGDAEICTDFHLKNNGADAVRILGIRTSCDCTTATASRSSVGPGESATIHAVFRLGHRLGLQEKTIEVTTDEASAQPTTLALRVAIAALVTCEPTAVVWKLRSRAEEKTITIAARPEATLVELIPPSVTPGFTLRIEATDEHQYRLHVRPTATNNVMNGIFSLTARLKDRPSQIVTVYALVR